MFNKLGFQNKVFAIFMVAFLFILASFAVYLYGYMKSTLVRTQQASLAPVAQKISDQIDMLYKQLDFAALGFTNNQDNLNTMVEMNSIAPESLDMLVHQSKLIHNLSATYNVVNELYKVVIFIPDKHIFFSYIRDDHPVSSIPFPYASPDSIDQLFGKNGQVAELPPHLDFWSTAPEKVVSVVRKFSTPYYTDFGFIELVLPYRTLERICSIDKEQTGKNVYIFDEKGMLVFPFNAGSHKENAALKLSDMIHQQNIEFGEMRLSNHSLLFNSYHSSYTEWTIVITDDEALFLQNLSYYRTLLITVSVIIFIAVMVIYYIIIRKLMKPLKHLTKSVRSINLNNLTVDGRTHEYNEYNEFILLNRSFEHMIERLRQSINQEYESRIREVEAHYSALQAQINPHFLFNTLNVIAVHCEETESDIAADMIYRLSEMMRYSGSSAQTSALLSEEMKYSVYYLELMKLHYDNSLFYEIDIPEPIGNLRFPKLSLQPFVENCINHGFDKALPPWKIKITGSVRNAMDWEIMIEDNGCGIQSDELSEIQRQLAEYETNFLEGKLVRNLQISGMGILNTYARLAIHFGEDFYFHISSMEGQGCNVRFGIRARLKEGER